MREKYKAAVLELGANLLCEYCRMSPCQFIRFMYFNRELPEDTRKRLDLITEAVGYLYGTYGKNSGAILRWFMRKRKRLGNFSPHDLLTDHAEYLFISHGQKILDLVRGANFDAI